MSPDLFNAEGIFGVSIKSKECAKLNKCYVKWSNMKIELRIGVNQIGR